MKELRVEMNMTICKRVRVDWNVLDGQDEAGGFTRDAGPDGSEDA
jgi:hypothetical protein